MIRKRGGDEFDVDELLLNITPSPSVEEGKSGELVEDIERRLFEVTEVKVNSVQVLPLEELLELLGMETQLKEKRIVDLRAEAPGGSSSKSESDSARKVRS